MRRDKPSSTAAIVCAARATTQARQSIRGFDDPYAQRLLPPEYTGRVSAVVRRAAWTFAHIIGLRTVAIDEGIRTAPALEQLVILGAGLDARAWRMPEIAAVEVFEVDHPSTQRYKRECIADFPAREKHHFVSVDFERESLNDRLEACGHRPDLPTIWVWEGVTMYLPQDAITATLQTLADRSAAGSRVLVTYLPPSGMRTAIGFGTGILGERFHAAFTPAELASLLGEHGFEVVADESSVEWHQRWAVDGVRLWNGFAATERMATADKR